MAIPRRESTTYDATYAVNKHTRTRDAILSFWLRHHIVIQEPRMASTVTWGWQDCLPIRFLPRRGQTRKPRATPWERGKRGDGSPERAEPPRPLRPFGASVSTSSGSPGLRPGLSSSAPSGLPFQRDPILTRRPSLRKRLGRWPTLPAPRTLVSSHQMRNKRSLTVDREPFIPPPSPFRLPPSFSLPRFHDAPSALPWSPALARRRPTASCPHD
jgi:hypothetical protein